MMLNMAKVLNDNLNPWTSIGLQTNLILNRLRNAQALRELANSDKQNDEETGSDADRSSKSEKDTKTDLEYVEHRLREIAAWEKRINPGKP
jgi:hypothetical protein